MTDNMIGNYSDKFVNLFILINIGITARISFDVLCITVNSFSVCQINPGDIRPVCNITAAAHKYRGGISSFTS
jgi:hypothetical protein